MNIAQSLKDDRVQLLNEVTHAGGKYERFYNDGSRVIAFRNGTLKRIFPNNYVVVNFPNGDTKQVLLSSLHVSLWLRAMLTAV